MSFKKILFVATAIFLGLQMQLAYAAGPCPDKKGEPAIRFLVPIGAPCVYPSEANGPLGLFEWYFNQIYPWFIGLAAGIALLYTVIGGLQIIYSGGDSGARQKGVEKLTTALFGLLMIIFSSIILQSLNPTFYI
ncbi:MAG: hypothetical protein JWM56_805 [Candidatus Peribacteria bacterium]|nr:hypothetical protein [Candidatus Peribacteria bacterium]